MGKTKSILNKAIKETTGYCWYIDYLDINGYPPPNYSGCQKPKNG